MTPTPNPSSDSAPLEERVTTAIAIRQRRIRLLSGLAWGLGGLSFLASAVIVGLYFTSYLPKQKQILMDIGASIGASHANVPSGNGADANTEPSTKEPERWERGAVVQWDPRQAKWIVVETEAQAAWRRDFPGIQSLMTHVLGMGTMLIALAVGLLSLGMLVILAVVFLTRRATLGQIQASLAQISAQLQNVRPATPGEL